MAEAAPQTEGNEARRRAMLQAAAELIAERGFGETRIADVAKRAGTSSGLVIYYFGTRDRLLVDALRFSEEAYYEAAATLLGEEPDFRKRLLDARRVVVRARAARARSAAPGACGWTSGRPPCATPRSARPASSSTAAGATCSSASSARARSPVPSTADVDARQFALSFTVVLDGLSTQVALDDPEITSDVAYDIGMEYAEQRLGLPPSKRRAKKRKR